MSDLKNTVKETAHKVADAAKDVGHKIACGASQAADFVKDKVGIGGPKEGSDVGVAGIKPHMEVISSCGCKMGTVDHMEGGSIKLTRQDSPDGQHHFIPTGWVARVDSHVHLTKNASETKQGWKADATAATAG